MNLFRPPLAALALLAAFLFSSAAHAQLALPRVAGLAVQADGRLHLEAVVPMGYRFVLLEGLANGEIGETGETERWSPLIAGGMDRRPAFVTFVLGDPQNFSMIRVRVGTASDVPEARQTGPDVIDIEYTGNGNGGPTLTAAQQAGHVLNRLAYGPSPDELGHVLSIGASAYVEEQLAPGDPDEPANGWLQTKLGPLYFDYLSGTGTVLAGTGEIWKYRKGTSEPPAAWKDPDFDDFDWLSGPTGIGYGDDDDATVLEDMRREDDNDGYLTVYVRKEFFVEDPSVIENLILAGQYDDGFVAYLNGTEVARENVSGNPPRYNRTAVRSAGNVDKNDVPDSFNLNEHLSLMNQGKNVIAIQVHNQSYTSSDLTADLEIVSAPSTPFAAIRGIDELQELIHLRGIYAGRQLQAVLGEFWENHFTTDYEKQVDFLRDIDEYDEIYDFGGGRRDRIRDQIDIEVARMEWQEYDFFHRNALGNFGDLLLYSATSPAMLIYLDNVLNEEGEPNENYSREILELYAFGESNRYTQTDIEQLARCFTGWTIKKVNPAFAKAFPESARDPETAPSVSIESEEVIVDLGSGWKYFKGRAEPSPDGEGAATLGWTLAGFDTTGWLNGSTGIGYADGDDTTRLNDMRNNYASVYLRREFKTPENLGENNLAFTVDYDDSYVAYLNGAEIARSGNLNGSPPAFDALAENNHEATGEPSIINLDSYKHLLRAAPASNLLAIQVHNGTLGSSDLTMRPRLVSQTYSPQSIPVTDPGGVWTFRFDPDKHDTDRKVLFEGTSYEVVLPGNRRDRDGVNDAIDVIDSMVAHPSTSEFITIKLINRFVSDDVTLTSYHNGTAPEELIGLVDSGIAAWNSTAPAGNIRTVMRAILDPQLQSTPFWSGQYYLNKVKTPVEFINSAVRAIGADVTGDDLHRRNFDMGMEIFEREAPDGYSEYGYDWTDTQGLLERMKFSQSLADDGDYTGTNWDVEIFIEANELDTTEDVLEFMNETLFQGQMTEQRKAVFLNFANTTLSGSVSMADGLRTSAKMDRIRLMIALILASPEFQYQ
jgi:hypothetical protein